MNILDFDVMQEEISPDNVIAISEIIAFSQTRFLTAYMGMRMQKIYSDLYEDIKCKNKVNRVFSDGYDLVQECALFLCEHFGKHLTDVIAFNSKGKPLTVRNVCSQKIMKLINRKSRDYYRNVDIEAQADEPSVEITEEEQQDYTEYDKIVESLNLTDNMKTALECRITGLSYPEIGRILGRVQSTVYEYFVTMRRRYIAIYG
ncbi:MAG: hypothetical protein NC311_14680 [Muribaculaceae bacterium]|nr:hypothetical protein [Muribaculaceae bacterium]MCM1440520.1 hypothetical protein [Roseburia sp.]